MPTIYFISPCDTCQRVLATVQSLADWKLRELKEEPLTEAEVDQLAELAGGYEPLFSRRARLYRSRGLHEQELSEADYRRLILEHYTFLNRPVMVADDQIFIGSAPKTVSAAVRAI